MYEIQGATHTAVPMADNRPVGVDQTDLIDHRESDSDLRFTVNPDGG